MSSANDFPKLTQIGCSTELNWVYILESRDVPRVDGQLAVARAFGHRSLKAHLSSEPDLAEVMIDDTEFFILASHGLWKVKFLMIYQATQLHH